MRVVSILVDAGVDAEVLSSGEEVGVADVMIALHARKSAHFTEDFIELNPTGKVIVYLTGTDLYSDIPDGCPICEQSLERADALVVSQEASLASVPEKYRAKTVVVHASIQLPVEVVDDSVTEPDLFLCVGHLRAVKQSFMAVKSLQLLDESVRLVLLGKEVDVDSGEIARKWEVEDSRFQWLGGVSYKESLKWMQRSVVTINTSLMEGGANSVGESIVLGVPVLASKVEGNVGMLGEDYVGYFSANSEQELAELMYRVLNDQCFLSKLRDQVGVRSKRFLRESETKDWVNLIQKIV
ncbi:MAG: glycosyltransferase [Akkermansiaceae bacterium]